MPSPWECCVPQPEFRILAIDTGSTSTKIGLFSNDVALFTKLITHSDEEMLAFRGRPVLDQLAFRRQAIEAALSESGCDWKALDAVSGRGGLMRPVASGTYAVNEEMLEDLRCARLGEHAANLGAFLARLMADSSGARAYVVDPVTVDEWTDVAHLSGTALLPRRCISHALNTKAIARRFARDTGRTYADLRLIVAHLGSGISISAHRDGRMIDGNLAGQEGPFSAERCGSQQLLPIVQLCFSGRYTQRELWNALIREGGIYSYLGTRDLREVERRMDDGDSNARLIFDGMAYQIEKQIGAMAAVLTGRVDAILFTGGMAHSERLTESLCSAVEWIAPVRIYPGEDELQALAEGALRVLRGEEAAGVLAPSDETAPALSGV